MKAIVILIPILPFVGFLVTLLVGRRMKRQAHLIPTALVTGSAALAVAAFVWVHEHEGEVFHYEPLAWITAGGPSSLWPGVESVALKVSWGFQVDSLTGIMLLVVGLIGMLVHYYSIGYMSDDPGYYRFFAYLNLFMFAMFILILADNYLLMFLGWEGVGLCSFLLISFWFRRKSASQAGKKAFLVNRVGDFGFTLGMFLIFVTTGTLQFTGVFEAAEAGDIGAQTLTWVCLLLFVGAVGKSAQFPLHVWLPDAMEGPTPVSALIHAATMVNAGVYMVARSYPLFIQSEWAMVVVMVIGTFTAVYAAFIALTQTDIKRVIAYSTVSSLGFMFMALGAGAWVAAVFYLFVHGFFKGLLFLCSGSVIHAMSGEQDLRKMGGLRRKLPLTFWTMLIGALAMVGVIPFAGFWAKDEILAGAYSYSLTVWVVGIITAFLTSIYMFRLMFLAFWGESRADEHVRAHIHESGWVMTIPLVLLAVPAALLGLLAGLPPEAGWIHGFLEPVFFEIEHHEFHWVGAGGLLMLVSLAVVLAGIAVAYRMYVRDAEEPKRLAHRLPIVYRASLNKLYMDEIYEVVPIRATVSFARWLWMFVDVKLIDGAVNGVAALWAWAGVRLRPLQTGRVQDYALDVLLGLLVLLVIFAWVWVA